MFVRKESNRNKEELVDMPDIQPLYYSNAFKLPHSCEMYFSYICIDLLLISSDRFRGGRVAE